MKFIYIIILNTEITYYIFEHEIIYYIIFLNIEIIYYIIFLNMKLYYILYFEHEIIIYILF